MRCVDKFAYIGISLTNDIWCGGGVAIKGRIVGSLKVDKFRQLRQYILDGMLCAYVNLYIIYINVLITN